MIKDQMNQLLQKEMDRKDFLKHVGIAAATIAGVPALFKALSQFQASPRRTHVGYGSSAYGGRKTTG